MIGAYRFGPGHGFDKETNALDVYWRGGEVEFDENSKAVLARQLVKLIAERLNAPRVTASPRAV